MLNSTTSATEKRRLLRERLASGEILRFPGAFNPLSARLIERKGFDGVYISGAVLSADLGLPDIGLTTLTEVAGRGQQIARTTELPALIDADTGFGEPMNVARTIQTLEDAGIAGCHIEDQVNPKRCGHLDGKAVVDDATALRRIRAAVDARRDPGFLVMARTDIRAVEGMPPTRRSIHPRISHSARAEYHPFVPPIPAITAHNRSGDAVVSAVRSSVKTVRPAQSGSLGSGSLGAPSTSASCQLVSTSSASTRPRASRTAVR